MITLRVVNIRIEHGDVYIGRPSQWRNSYRIGNDGTREEVIEQFRNEAQWSPFVPRDTLDLRDRIEEVHRARIESGGDPDEPVTLGCYCTPKPCHGDVWVDRLCARWPESFRRASNERS